ncbi:hypothetical protein BJY00DRAFT_192658 [Aspergillus carlsbadensis]|nr:hypothetical protein BJY00DRAFT_192658 [Aspergillus carlsbadensis]
MPKPDGGDTRWYRIQEQGQEPLASHHCTYVFCNKQAAVVWCNDVSAPFISLFPPSLHHLLLTVSPSPWVVTWPSERHWRRSQHYLPEMTMALPVRLKPARSNWPSPLPAQCPNGDHHQRTRRVPTASCSVLLLLLKLLEWPYKPFNTVVSDCGRTVYCRDLPAALPHWIQQAAAVLDLPCTGVLPPSRHAWLGRFHICRLARNGRELRPVQP